MKRKHTKRVAVFLIPILLGLGTGCTYWWPSKGPTSLAGLQLDADLPRSWMIAKFSQGVFLTRHGMELQSIHIRRWPRTEIVKGTNRSISDGMIPIEIAELSLDSRRLDDGVGGLNVLENAPVTVDDRDCYRIVYEYTNQPGLRMRTREYGCAVGPWMYRFEYTAAAQHYYDTYLPDFEQVRKSARFSVK